MKKLMENFASFGSSEAGTKSVNNKEKSDNITQIHWSSHKIPQVRCLIASSAI